MRGAGGTHIKHLFPNKDNTTEISWPGLIYSQLSFGRVVCVRIQLGLNILNLFSVFASPTQGRLIIFIENICSIFRTYSGTPLIRSPVGQKNGRTSNGVAVLPGQGQISRLKCRNDKYTLHGIRTCTTVFSVINNRNVDIAYSNCKKTT